MARLYGAAIRLGCLAAAAFAGFLAFVAVIASDGARPGWGFHLAFLALVVVEVVCYVRVRALLAQAAFFRRHRGAPFLIGTARKGWHPLMTRLAASLPEPWRFVWWRERVALEPLGVMIRPPADLPCVAIVGDASVMWLPAGNVLRAFRRRPTRENTRHAIAELTRLANENGRLDRDGRSTKLV